MEPREELAKWATNWGVAEVKTPTGAEICESLFKHPPLEWSRIAPFQDRTMVLMCQRLLPEAESRSIYLQGVKSFKLPKGYLAVKVYCSPLNPGAKELAEELNGIWPGLLEVAKVESWSDLHKCDHMLLYLNALTWKHDPESFASEIREAMQVGLHLQPCHEFPSVIDQGTTLRCRSNESIRAKKRSIFGGGAAAAEIDGGNRRHALEFKQIMDATPADLKKSPTNIYSQIAIALKGGDLREPGLINLAAKLAVHVDRLSRLPDRLMTAEGGKPPLHSSRGRSKSWGPIRSLRSYSSNNAIVGACHPGEMRVTSPFPRFVSQGSFRNLPLRGSSSKPRGGHSTCQSWCRTSEAVVDNTPVDNTPVDNTPATSAAGALAIVSSVSARGAA